MLEMLCVLAYSYRKCARNFMYPGSGNVPEILPYTVPGKVKEMSKFPGVGNFHAMNNSVGTSRLCQHKFKHNRSLKALSIIG